MLSSTSLEQVAVSILFTFYCFLPLQHRGPQPKLGSLVTAPIRFAGVVGPILIALSSIEQRWSRKLSPVLCIRLDQALLPRKDVVN